MKIYVVGSDSDINRMWVLRGHDLVTNLKEADVVQFIGGADVNPELYGETPIARTTCCLDADKRDIDIWRQTQPHQLKVGICRG